MTVDRRRLSPGVATAWMPETQHSRPSPADIPDSEAAESLHLYSSSGEVWPLQPGRPTGSEVFQRNRFWRRTAQEQRVCQAPPTDPRFASASEPPRLKLSAM